MPAAQRLALDLTALDFALDRDITPAPGALDRRPAAAALLLDRGPLADGLDCDLDLLALLLALFLGDRATAAGGTRFALNRHHR